MVRLTILAASVLTVSLALGQPAWTTGAKVAPVAVGQSPNSSAFGSRVYFAGQPTQADLAEYATHYRSLPERWKFATGEESEIAKLGTALGLIKEGTGAALTHNLRTIVVDPTGRIQRVFMGTNPAYKNYKDITLEELACAVPIVILSVLLGVFPHLVLGWMEPSVSLLVDSLARFR